MEYLGFWVTRTGIRPINKKVESIVNMTPPKNTNKVREFIGIVKYYRDIWAKGSHLIHPLTALTSHKITFKWTDVEQKVFDDINSAVYQDTLLAYTDFNKRFDIHKYPRNYYLGAVLIQNGKPIDLYRRKLTGPQKRYTLTEKELLSIVETLKEFLTILLGKQLKIYSDHKT